MVFPSIFSLSNIKTLKWKSRLVTVLQTDIHYAALTTVGDNPDGGVTLSKTRDGGEAHFVGFRLYQLSQVVCHELSFVDWSVHWDLLFPPALQPHLNMKRNHKRSTLLKQSLRSPDPVTTHINTQTFVCSSLQSYNFIPAFSLLFWCYNPQLCVLINCF